MTKINLIIMLFLVVFMIHEYEEIIMLGVGLTGIGEN